jgi:hypothetical protein
MNPRRALPWIAASLLAFTATTIAQISIEPPTAPATQPSAPRPTAPSAGVTSGTSAPGKAGSVTTLPSSDAMFQNIVRDRSDYMTPAPATPSPTPAQPLVEGVAPNEPPPLRLKEGQYITNRVGRLVRDEKSGIMLFVFDSDGKQMAEPPMGVIPSSLLALMEDASDHGTKPVRFRVSGEVTQYRGRNYLYIKAQQTIRDLNQGLGG